MVCGSVGMELVKGGRSRPPSRTWSLSCPSHIDGVQQRMGVGDAFQCASSGNAAGEGPEGWWNSGDRGDSSYMLEPSPTNWHLTSWMLNVECLQLQVSILMDIWMVGYVYFESVYRLDVHCQMQDRVTRGCDWGRVERESRGEERMQLLCANALNNQCRQWWSKCQQGQMCCSTCTRQVSHTMSLPILLAPDLCQPKIVRDMFRGIVTHTFVMAVGGNLNSSECWRA